MHRGKLIVISAPSGSGKTTIAKEIMKLNPSLGFSVSATTRRKRDSEVDGRDYFFLTDEEFRRRAGQGEFVETEEVYPGKLYGTLKSEVDRLLNSGCDVLFDVDVKGGLAIKTQYPDACLIFIKAPNMETLRRRLTERKTEDQPTIQSRLDRVQLELELGTQFDHQVVNDVLSTAVETVQGIVKHHLENNKGDAHAH